MPVQVRAGDLALTLDRTAGGLTVDGAPAEAHVHSVGPRSLHVLVGGRSRVATVEPAENGRTRVTIGGQAVEVEVKDARALLMERFGFASADTSAERFVRAPMPGLVVRLLAEPGQHVEAGQGLVVLEAMKMENELRAPSAGTVAALHVEPGAAVGKGALLVELA